MSPKALIFSSEQETSRLVSQALTEFGFEVEACVEIFAAVERLTSRGFDVIAADWDDGVEASFLLKTACELKSNCEAFTIVMAKPEVVAAARHAGADLVLNKPILPGQARQTLLGSQEFAAKFQGGQILAISEPTQAANPYNQLVSPPPPPPRVEPPSFLKTRQLLPPSPAPKTAVVTSLQDHLVSLGEHLHAAPTHVSISGEQFRRSSIQTLFSSTQVTVPHKNRLKLDLKKFWRGSVYGFFLLACGTFLYGPVRSGSLAVFLNAFWKAASVTVQSTLTPSPKLRKAPLLAEIPDSRYPSLLTDRVERISVDSIRKFDSKSDLLAPEVNMAYSLSRPLETLAQIEPLPLMPQLQASSTPLQPFPHVLYESVPQSLRFAPPVVSIRDSGLRPSPSLLTMLEPVNVDEEVADKLVVQKVAPVYPDQALRTGMQGTVILQALVSKEGLVEDLKLMGGSLILGEAAVQAVRQWRYQPYFINGHPVETQTQVTVEFKLPAVAVVAGRPISKP